MDFISEMFADRMSPTWSAFLCLGIAVLAIVYLAIGALAAHFINEDYQRKGRLFPVPSLPLRIVVMFFGGLFWPAAWLWKDHLYYQWRRVYLWNKRRLIAKGAIANNW